MAVLPCQIQYSNGTLATPSTFDNVAQVFNPAYAGIGADASANPPAALATLASGIVTHAGQLYVQNQSSATIQVILNPNAIAPAKSTIILIDPGAGVNHQGGDWQASSNMPWFTGPFIIAGPYGSQVAANFN
jgi:hypothetical protein